MSLKEKLIEKHGDELNNVDDIEELNLDGLTTISKFTQEDKKYLEKFNSLVMLSASGLQLTSVENFPHLPLLQTVP